MPKADRWTITTGCMRNDVVVNSQSEFTKPSRELKGSGLQLPLKPEQLSQSDKARSDVIKKFNPSQKGSVQLGEGVTLELFMHTDEEFDYIQKHYESPEVANRLFHNNFPMSESMAFMRKQLLGSKAWTAWLDGEIVGFAYIDVQPPEYKIAGVHGYSSRKVWGKGYAHNVLTFCKYQAFEVLGLDKIEGYVSKPNNLIRKFYLRGGFQREAVLRNRVYDKDKSYPFEIYGFTREDYQKENK